MKNFSSDVQSGSRELGFYRSGRQKGADMKVNKMVVVNSAAAAAVISILVSVVGAGTKWMGN